jgi:hypothetical protein
LAADQGHADVQYNLGVTRGRPLPGLGGGWLSAYQGDAEAAIPELRMVLHLMPFEPLRHLAFIGIGCAHFSAGRHAKAARWAQSGVEACPDSFWGARVAAAAAAHAGARTEARRIVRSILRCDPYLTVSEAREAWPFRPDFMDRLAQGLADADLPMDLATVLPYDRPPTTPSAPCPPYRISMPASCLLPKKFWCTPRPALKSRKTAEV